MAFVWRILMHGMKGKRNAQLGTKPADKVIQFRITGEMKDALVRQACQDGKKLTPWILEKLGEHLDSDSFVHTV
jgi:hypothetical protein